MASADDVTIEELTSDEDDQIKRMLVELTEGEQLHYNHPRETRDELSARLRVSPRFTGENHVLVARDPEGEALGLCWVVLFDPGTGLEGEVAELYVRPDARERGIARRLVHEAVTLLRNRHVMFAAVWTRDDNQAALAAYRAAGFTPTTQTVLTWLPLPDGGS